jgi:hypothetical protein
LSRPYNFSCELPGAISYTEGMNFYSLQSLPASHGRERNRNFLFAGILLADLLLGCGTGDSDTFVRFEVEGKSYEVKNPTLVVTRMPFNIHFLDLTNSSTSLAPGALVQWRMKLESLEQLVGENLDLKTVDPNHIEPVVIFRITQDLSVHSQQHSNIHLKIDRIKDDIVEGSFSGKDLVYVSRTQEVAGKVDVTAQFRVNLIQKKAGQ